MNLERRGLIFFWLVQVLIAPALICFLATCVMRLGYRPRLLWELGAAMALVQIPFAALAMVFTFAASTGELVTRTRLRTMCMEIAAAILMIVIVFSWRSVYRVL